jgi:hypothetical protein
MREACITYQTSRSVVVKALPDTTNSPVPIVLPKRISHHFMIRSEYLRDNYQLQSFAYSILLAYEQTVLHAPKSLDL